MRNQDILNQKKETLQRPLILDGAIGTLLQQRGYEADKHIWYSHLNITEPDVIIKLHEEYVNAGADIITTNTFRTNPIAKKKSSIGITNADLVRQSVSLAHKAKGNSDLIIAGSNAPAEDCYKKARTVSKFDLEYNHKKHIELLYESGCDIIWNETQSHWDEIEIVCKFCSENTIPFSMNLYFNDNLNLLSGEPLSEAISLLENYSQQVIGFNCIRTNLLKEFSAHFPLPPNFGFYFNTAQSNVTENNISCILSPQEYMESIKEFFVLQPIFVGSCCGSSPAHTKEIKDYFDETN